MDQEMITARYNIVAAAVDLHIGQEKPFTIKQLAAKAGIKPSEIYRHFNSKTHILPAYYPLLVDRYRIMTGEIEGFTAFTLEEKLSNFIYTCFDMLQENREFVDDTIEVAVFSGKSENFRDNLGSLIAEFMDQDSQIPATTRTVLCRQPVYHWLSGEFIHLLKFWYRDSSPQYQNTIALTDKLVSFLGEVLYSQAADKGLDLLKYMAGQGLLRFGPLNWLLRR